MRCAEYVGRTYYKKYISLVAGMKEKTTTQFENTKKGYYGRVERFDSQRVRAVAEMWTEEGKAMTVYSNVDE
jgi:hypothetical protein